MVVLDNVLENELDDVTELVAVALVVDAIDDVEVLELVDVAVHDVVVESDAGDVEVLALGL